jgi:hypothetical protein
MAAASVTSPITSAEAKTTLLAEPASPSSRKHQEDSWPDGSTRRSAAYRSPKIRSRRREESWNDGMSLDGLLMKAEFDV